ncbi:hypothetical protein ACFL1Y_01370 [Patescibacteria group bacterium]
MQKLQPEQIKLLREADDCLANAGEKIGQMMPVQGFAGKAPQLIKDDIEKAISLISQVWPELKKGETENPLTGYE